MENDILRLFFTLLVAFLVSFASTPIVNILAHRIGAVDIPATTGECIKRRPRALAGLRYLRVYRFNTLLQRYRL